MANDIGEAFFVKEEEVNAFAWVEVDQKRFALEGKLVFHIG